MSRKYDLVGIGDPFLDLVIKLPQLPDHNVNCRMDSYCFQGGGNVPTALVAAARLGLSCALFGSAGDDLFGRMSLSDLEYNGVDVSKMLIDKGQKSNFCLCVTESAVEGKEFISKPGSFRELTPEDLDEEAIRSAKMLHTGLITPTVLTASDWIHESGGKVSIDAAYYRPYVYENYRYFDIFIASELYYTVMCEENGYDPAEYEQNMRRLMAEGPEVVIFTFGGDGCRGVHAGGYFELPSIPVKVVDTTGAGDVFHGAFDYAWLQGWDAEKCARFATGVSAVKCTRPGGRSGIPTLEVLEKFLTTGETDYTEIDERVAHYERGILE